MEKFPCKKCNETGCGDYNEIFSNYEECFKTMKRKLLDSNKKTIEKYLKDNYCSSCAYTCKKCKGKGYIYWIDLLVK